MRLEDPVFTEPNPFNPPGKLQLSDVSNPFAFDLTLEGPAPHLKREPDGSVLVPVFTDLKRHDMGEKLDSDLIVQNGVPTGEWLTRKLWGIASEPPFLHHGRATLLSEAILMHGGEAQESRDAYGALAPEDQAAVVEFLKVPPGAPGGRKRGGHHGRLDCAGQPRDLAGGRRGPRRSPPVGPRRTDARRRQAARITGDAA